jgi:hypothetical protein
MDQIYGAGVVCCVPEARDGKSTRELMEGAALVPRFRNLQGRSKNFIRGYALNVSSSTHPMDPRNLAAYGKDLQEKLDSYSGSGFHIGIMGEVLAHYEHCVSIDKSVVDAWNIPALHINTRYTDNEFNMARDAVDTSMEPAHLRAVDSFWRRRTGSHSIWRP